MLSSPCPLTIRSQVLEHQRQGVTVTLLLSRLTQTPAAPQDSGPKHSDANLKVMNLLLKSVSVFYLTALFLCALTPFSRLRKQAPIQQAAELPSLFLHAQFPLRFVFHASISTNHTANL